VHRKRKHGYKPKEFCVVSGRRDGGSKLVSKERAVRSSPYHRHEENRGSTSYLPSSRSFEIKSPELYIFGDSPILSPASPIYNDVPATKMEYSNNGNCYAYFPPSTSTWRLEQKFSSFFPNPQAPYAQTQSVERNSFESWSPSTPTSTSDLRSPYLSPPLSGHSDLDFDDFSCPDNQSSLYEFALFYTGHPLRA